MNEERLNTFKVRMSLIDSAELLLYWFIIDDELRKRLKGGVKK